jgi:hypothetical protein
MTFGGPSAHSVRAEAGVADEGGDGALPVDDEGWSFEIEWDGMVTDYETARGAPFNDDERQVLAAGQRWVTSYGARCQHSDDLLGLFPHVDHSRGWPRLLRELLARYAPR